MFKVFGGRSERDGDRDRKKDKSREDAKSSSGRRKRRSDNDDATSVITSASHRTDSSRTHRHRDRDEVSRERKRRSDRRSSTELTEGAVRTLDDDDEEEDWESDEDDRRTEKSSRRRSQQVDGGLKSRSTHSEREGKSSKLKDESSSRRSAGAKSSSTRSRDKTKAQSIVDGPGEDRALPAMGSFDQFPGMYSASVVRPNDGPEHTMSGALPLDSHVPNQFPGQNPSTYARPDFNPNPHGEAADYYNDQGQSVEYQPGIRPHTPMMLHNPDTHLFTPSAAAAPIADTGNGSAADFYSGKVSPVASQSLPAAGTDGPEFRPSKPGKASGKIGAGIASAVTAAAVGSLIGGKPAKQSSTAFPQKPARHNSEPVFGHSGDIYSTPAAVTGKSDSKHSNHSGLYTAAGAAALGAAAYNIGHAGGRDDRLPSTPMHQTSGYYTSGSSLHQQHHLEHKSPIAKIKDGLLNLISNPEDVAKMEAYTEYIGVCKHCFDPRSSPWDGPRRHHYHPRKRDSFESLRRRSHDRLRHKSSGERIGMVSRVEKDSRYAGLDRRGKGTSRAEMGGLGALGAGAVATGAMLWGSGKDFDDTYSVKSGRRIDSSKRRSSRSSSRERRSRTSYGVIGPHRDEKAEWVSVRNKDGTIERRKRVTSSKSRSRSRNRKGNLVGVASGAALGAAALGVASSRRASSRDKHGEKVFVRHRRRSSSSRSRNSSPGLADIFGISSKKSSSRPSRRYSPSRTSYAVTRRGSSPRQDDGLFGGFFAEPKQRRHSRGRGDRGFFTFSNGSVSSSDSELAFGEGLHDRSRLGSKSSKAPLRGIRKPTRKTSEERMTAAVAGIGATAAALAAAQRGQRITKRPSRPELGARRHTREFVEGHSVAGAENDEWEDELPSDASSVSSHDSGLAFGADPRRGRMSRESMDSLASKTSEDGLAAWAWRWGGKKEKKRKHAPGSETFYDARQTPSAIGTVNSATGPFVDSRRTSSHGVPAPMQHIDPRPLSETGTGVQSRQPSMPGSFTADEFSQNRPGPAPLQQPQPIAPFNPSFSRDGTEDPRLTQKLRRAQTDPVQRDSSWVQDAALIGGAALATASIIASSGKKPKDNSNVRFGLTEEQQRKEDEMRRREREREADDRRRQERTRQLKDEAARTAREEDERRQREQERRAAAKREAEDAEHRDKARATEERRARAQRDADAQALREADDKRRRSQREAEERAQREAEDRSRREANERDDRERERRRASERAEKDARRRQEEREFEEQEARYRRERERQRDAEEQERFDKEDHHRKKQSSSRDLDRRQDVGSKTSDAWKAPVAAGVAGAVVGSILEGARHKDARDADRREERVEEVRPATYSARTVEPSNEHSGTPVHDDDLFDPNFFKRKRSQSEVARDDAYADKVVSDREAYYNAPVQTQAEIFAPAELLNRDAEEKERNTDPRGGNDVHEWHASDDEVRTHFDHPSYAKDLPPGFTHRSIPRLNVIAPTPPPSQSPRQKPRRHADTTSTEEQPPVKESKAADETDLPKTRPRGVSWGQDQTHVYQPQTPDSMVDRGSYVESRESPKHHFDEIVVEQDEDDGSSKTTRYNAEDLSKNKRSAETPAQTVLDKILKRDEDVEEVTREPLADEQFAYKQPFYESVSDVAFAMDSPGTEGAPPVRGWVEDEEVETPLPKDDASSTSRKGQQDPSVEEKTRSAPDTEEDWSQLSKKERRKREKMLRSALDDEAEEAVPDVKTSSAKDVATPEDDSFNLPLSKKEKKRRDKASKRSSTVDTIADDAHADSSSPVEAPSSRAEPEFDDFSAVPLSKKDKKKRDKALKRSSTIDSITDDNVADSSSAAESPAVDYSTFTAEPEQDDGFAVPLSKKDKKKRDKAKRSSIVDNTSDSNYGPASKAIDSVRDDGFTHTTSDSAGTPEADEEWSLSKKDKKRRKADKRSSLADSFTENGFAGVASESRGIDTPSTSRADDEAFRSEKETQRPLTTSSRGAVGSEFPPTNERETSAANDTSQTREDVPLTGQEKSRLSTLFGRGGIGSVVETVMSAGGIAALAGAASRSEEPDKQPKVAAERVDDDVLDTPSSKKDEKSRRRKKLGEATFTDPRDVESFDLSTNDSAVPPSTTASELASGMPGGWDEDDTTRDDTKRSDTESTVHASASEPDSVDAEELWSETTTKRSKKKKRDRSSGLYNEPAVSSPLRSELPRDDHSSNGVHTNGHSTRDVNDTGDLQQASRADIDDSGDFAEPKKSKRRSRQTPDDDDSTKEKKKGILGSIFGKKSDDGEPVSSRSTADDHEDQNERRHRRRRTGSSYGEDDDHQSVASSGYRRHDDTWENDDYSRRDYDPAQDEDDEDRRRRRRRRRTESRTSEDQSFLEMRVEDLPPLPDSRSTSPTSASARKEQDQGKPASAEAIGVGAVSGAALFASHSTGHGIRHVDNSDDQNDLPPLPDSEPGSPVSPLHSTPRPGFPVRPASSTAVPLRFRPPPKSPQQGHSRSGSLESPVESSPSQGITIRPKIIRARTTDTHSREFKPLYLAERHSKALDPLEEDLPSLPSSKPSSRASSVLGSEEYHSAAESVASESVYASPKSEKSLRINTDLPKELRDEDILDSQQTTPRAGAFDSDTTGLARQEPQFYTWEDLVRDHARSVEHETARSIAEGDNNQQNLQPASQHDPSPKSSLAESSHLAPQAVADVTSVTPEEHHLQAVNIPLPRETEDEYDDLLDHNDASAPAPVARSHDEQIREDAATVHSFETAESAQYDLTSRKAAKKAARKGKKAAKAAMTGISSIEKQQPIDDAESEEYARTHKRQDTQVRIDSLDREDVASPMSLANTDSTYPGNDLVSASDLASTQANEDPWVFRQTKKKGKKGKKSNDSRGALKDNAVLATAAATAAGTAAAAALTPDDLERSKAVDGNTIVDDFQRADVTGDTEREVAHTRPRSSLSNDLQSFEPQADNLEQTFPDSDDLDITQTTVHTSAAPPSSSSQAQRIGHVDDEPLDSLQDRALPVSLPESDAVERFLVDEERVEEGLSNEPEPVSVGREAESHYASLEPSQTSDENGVHSSSQSSFQLSKKESKKAKRRQKAKGVLPWDEEPILAADEESASAMHQKSTPATNDTPIVDTVGVTESASHRGEEQSHTGLSVTADVDIGKEQSSLADEQAAVEPDTFFTVSKRSKKDKKAKKQRLSSTWSPDEDQTPNLAGEVNEEQPLTLPSTDSTRPQQSRANDESTASESVQLATMAVKQHAGSVESPSDQQNPSTTAGVEFANDLPAVKDQSLDESARSMMTATGTTADSDKRYVDLASVDIGDTPIDHTATATEESQATDTTSDSWLPFTTRKKGNKAKNKTSIPTAYQQPETIASAQTAQLDSHEDTQQAVELPNPRQAQAFPVDTSMALADADDPDISTPGQHLVVENESAVPIASSAEVKDATSPSTLKPEHGHQPISEAESKDIAFKQDLTTDDTRLTDLDHDSSHADAFTIVTKKSKKDKKKAKRQARGNLDDDIETPASTSDPERSTFHPVEHNEDAANNMSSQWNEVPKKLSKKEKRKLKQAKFDEVADESAVPNILGIAQDKTESTQAIKTHDTVIEPDLPSVTSEVSAPVPDDVLGVASNVSLPEDGGPDWSVDKTIVGERLTAETAQPGQDHQSTVGTVAPVKPPGDEATDFDFAATLAAGLAGSGFDPDLVAKDPIYHRRASPPGTIPEAVPDEPEFQSFSKKQKKRKGKKAALEEPTQESSSTATPKSTDTPYEGDFDSALAQGLQLGGFDASILQRSMDVSDGPGPDLQDDSTFISAKRKKPKRKSRSTVDPGSTEVNSESGYAKDASVVDDAKQVILPPVPDLEVTERSQPVDPLHESLTKHAEYATDTSNQATQPGDLLRKAEDTIEEASISSVRGHQQSLESTSSRKIELEQPLLKDTARSRVTATVPSDILSSGEMDIDEMDQAYKAYKRNKRKAKKEKYAAERAAESATDSKDDPTAQPTSASVKNSNQETVAEADVLIRPSTPLEQPWTAGRTTSSSALAGAIAAGAALAATSLRGDVSNRDANDTHHRSAAQSQADWSFSPLDAESQQSQFPHSSPTRPTVRDSGYQSIDTPVLSQAPDASQFTDSRAAGRTPLHIDVDTDPDWTVQVSKQRRPERERGVEQPRSRTPSGETPLEPTSRNRASYLYQSPPETTPESQHVHTVPHRTPEHDGPARSSVEQSPSARAGLDTIVEESNGRKRSIDMSHIDPQKQENAVRRRLASPVDRDHSRILRGSHSPETAAAQRSVTSPLDARMLAGSETAARRVVSDPRSPSVLSNRSNGSVGLHRIPDELRSFSRASSGSGYAGQAHGLRRTSMSGDLRAASRASLRGSGSAVGLRNSPKTIPFEPPPTPPSYEDDEQDVRLGASRAVDMADVYQGYGGGHEAHISPTRPPSVRKRQSMHILELESRLDQLAAENRALADARQSRGLYDHGDMRQVLEQRELELREKDAELHRIEAMLRPMQAELDRLTEINNGLTEANRNLVDDTNGRYATLQTEHEHAHQQWQTASRELDDMRSKQTHLATDVKEAIAGELSAALAEKDSEIRRLREELEVAAEKIRSLQVQISSSRSADFLVQRDEDYFDGACQRLCQHAQQWVLRFSKSSDNRICRLSTELHDDKIEARLDNAIIDGSDVDKLLGDRVKRRDVFMSVVTTMIWEYVFTRYLFGMDREQRQKLKTLEKTLSEVGPPRAVAQWRATTLTLLSKRPSFAEQCDLDTEAVAQEIYAVLNALLPPPSSAKPQLIQSLQRVVKVAVDLSIEMRTQRAEFIMLPPLQPEYDNNGDLVRKMRFNAALMNERSGMYSSNEELEADQAVVKLVLFPPVVKKGDDFGEGAEEIVVCPAQVLVHNDGGRSKKVVRVMSGAMDIDDPRASRQSLISTAPGPSVMS